MAFRENSRISMASDRDRSVGSWRLFMSKREASVSRKCTRFDIKRFGDRMGEISLEEKIPRL